MPKNMAASVRARLLTLARARGEDFDYVLRQYVMQRLLYRLSRSEYADQFLLKGALLFRIWNEESHRPTRDIDLLSFDAHDVPLLVEVFRRITAIGEDDGLDFDGASVAGVEIKGDAEYPGVRVTGVANLGTARVPFQADVGYGDAVVPPAEKAQLPSFLDLPAPQLRIYSVYSVIAEKFQAMVMLGQANSRMKDFFDIRTIAKTMPLEGGLLCQAIAATFERRKTGIRNAPLFVLSETFATDTDKQTQWQAFEKKNEMEPAVEFKVVIADLIQLLLPAYEAIAQDQAFDANWSPDEFMWREP
ncbi:nucleotidyl transferase AbiEii/AbiGii toxin family protein [Sedimenticola hydrogenitrophicus]|uniref:nucleotidyl transferase AbiEii/AbiGii toxin family protein n=1 Tax=Sedimenticola hydrogenitrophicus TaxID=2967975 RepID=UPI0021A4B9CA|nr:nucleotidyl transferase AbiEii/AbiGii toxin family protein [Sedimenticola hydrogenitrophicus]